VHTREPRLTRGLDPPAPQHPPSGKHPAHKSLSRSKLGSFLFSNRLTEPGVVKATSAGAILTVCVPSTGLSRVTPQRSSTGRGDALLSNPRITSLGIRRGVCAPWHCEHARTPPGSRQAGAAPSRRAGRDGARSRPEGAGRFAGGQQQAPRARAEPRAEGSCRGARGCWHCCGPAEPGRCPPRQQRRVPEERAAAWAARQRRPG